MVGGVAAQAARRVIAVIALCQVLLSALTQREAHRGVFLAGNGVRQLHRRPVGGAINAGANQWQGRTRRPVSTST